jgi:predicted Mrr-cat superfamily restriction endonuclease
MWGPSLKGSGQASLHQPDGCAIAEVSHSAALDERLQHQKKIFEEDEEEDDNETDISTYYLDNPQLAGRKTQEVFRFVEVIAEGDIVLASDGANVLSMGRVIRGYTYEPSSDFPHRRAVEWRSLAEWHLPISEGLRTTVYEVKHDVRNLIAIVKASSLTLPQRRQL